MLIQLILCACSLAPCPLPHTLFSTIPDPQPPATSLQGSRLTHSTNGEFCMPGLAACIQHRIVCQVVLQGNSKICAKQMLTLMISGLHHQSAQQSVTVMAFALQAKTVSVATGESILLGSCDSDGFCALGQDICGN
eukprot:scaffold125953_cov15-Tisochrysis_lutea.AAC.1